MQICQNPIECQPVQPHVQVHNEFSIYMLSKMQSNIQMSLSTCSIQGLHYKPHTWEFYCSWNS